MRVFRLGGVEIPFRAGFSLQQSYRPIGGYSVLRMLTGTAIKQQHWEKLGTTVSGNGMFPPGLDSLDYSNALVMQCVADREVTKNTPAMEVTQNRRTDSLHDAEGFALTEVYGEWVPTPILTSIASGTRPGYDDVTLEAVSGAIAYRVRYLPQISVFTERPSVDDQVHDGEYSWTLEAEEV